MSDVDHINKKKKKRSATAGYTSSEDDEDEEEEEEASSENDSNDDSDDDEDQEENDDNDDNVNDNNDNNDDGDDNDDNDKDGGKKSKKRKLSSSAKASAKKKRAEAFKNSLIDDAAVHSGSEDEEDDEEDEELDGNEYVKDDFVVDDSEVARERGGDDGLEDSDDDDDDDDDEDSGADRRKGRKRVGKLQDRLTQEDLDLIEESKGNYRAPRDDDVDRDDDEARKRKVAKIQELRNQLFIDDDDDGKEGRKKKPKKAAVENFDEDGMAEFIDYGDDENGARYRDDMDMERSGQGVSEAQLDEANAIFGTDFLEFMAEGDNAQDDDLLDDDERESKKFRERGVGVDLGVDSDDDVDISDSEDDDALFGSGDEDETTGEKRSEALRLKREQRRLKKEERRKKKAEQRKARLRRAFEPVQLIENFCTERDDEIRIKDAPERFFDWKTPFHGPSGAITSIILAEEQEALWIIKRIPDIATEYMIIETEADTSMTNEDFDLKKRAIVESVIKTLRFIHREKLEPEFIRKYRADEVTSSTVRDNIFAIMDEDTEWERLLNAKKKVEALLETVTSTANADDALGADEEYVLKLKEDLKIAKDRLDESVREEDRKQNELNALEQDNKNKDDDDDDDDDELFGDDDDDDDEKDKDIAKQKESLMSHLKTTQSLVKVCAEQVSSVEASLKVAEENSASTQPGQKNAIMASNKICRDKLWHYEDFKRYLANLNDYNHVMDFYKYLTLIKEGNDAVRTKNSLATDGTDTKKRSRRFDRDYYRTCVSQGLRQICYQFALAPFRVGIKLEDNLTKPEGFNWDSSLPGDNPNEGDDLGPRQWNAPVNDSDPTSFASELVSSGELVLLAAMDKSGKLSEDHPEVSDPFRGCRYVAAMELAYEPRIRRHLRELYKQKAVLTTQQTPKGVDVIDPFHEYYGLHLLRNKKVKDHFHPNERELQQQVFGYSVEDVKELNEKLKSNEKQSCIQYLNIMKAEKSGHIKVHIHLPLLHGDSEDWYKKGDDYFKNREKQDLGPLIEELRKAYYPSDGDMEEWNNERDKILRFALTNFLLPAFEADMLKDLRDAAIKVGIAEAGKNLSMMAMEGPYRPSHLLGDNRFLVPTGDLPIVGVCCASDGKDASYLAALTERGEVSDHLAIPSGIQIDSAKIKEKVMTFLMQARPSAIVVGSHAGLSSRLVARKLGALATEATERWNNRFIQGQEEDDEEYQARQDDFRRLYPDHDDEDDEESEWKCNVEMVDDNVAQLFGRSVRGKKEFPDGSVNMKCAVSIARHAKDPLAELAYTWSVASDTGVFGTEMLFMNIHPLQRLLPKTHLLRQYERVLCRAVAEVGVDMNLSCKYSHLHGLLTFIPGLGPRKAASLKHGMERLGGVVASRRDLLEKRLLGPFVYNNAVGFLRIRDIDALSNQLLHPLDDTRLHPHVYTVNNWASKIAIDALEMENDDQYGSEDDRAITAIRDIMENSHNEVRKLYEATKKEWENQYGLTFNVGAWDPRINVPAGLWRDKVDELDLETFAEMIEKDGNGKWLTHFSMIKWEFRLPFVDPRKPMEPLEKEKLFRLLTGETDQTLCPGREVTGKVARISDFGAHLKLEGDVPAFIPLRNLANGHVECAEDIVQVGQIVTAIVTEVKKDHMSVDLSLKEEDLKRSPSSWDRPSSLPPLDQCFSKSAAIAIEEEKSKDREERLSKMNINVTNKNTDKPATAIGRTGRISNRACGHPAFRNASSLEVEKELKEGGPSMVGEALIRPSSKNADVLALHWLAREEIIKVIEVHEEDKDNDASIGNTLRIKEETFGSIDELLASYIAPMNDRSEELQLHKKFVNLAESEVDKVLVNAKKQNPSGVFYHLCWNQKYPGYVSLRYIINKTPRYHHVGIVPEGYTWCKKNYSDLNLLINDFKKYPNGLSVKSKSNSTSSAQAAKVPSKQNRWGSKNTPTSTSRQPTNMHPPSWAPPPQPVAASAGWGSNTRPPPSLPPPPQHAYPPAPPGNPTWGQQRPPPPPLPPTSQHRYPPMPPGAPPGFPSQ